ncbi:MAG: potassium-transporting ATPase subunit KdpA [bacterium]
MTANAWLQVTIYFVMLTLLVAPLGKYMAQVSEGEPTVGSRLLGPLERWCYRLAGVDAQAQMTWQTYALAMLAFNLAGLVLVYVIQRLQGVLPWNPAHLSAVSSDSAFNTAVSFVTNTNWQGYGGETTMSYFTQMVALTTQNFVSAATGMAILVALIRGFARKSTTELGNFWVDLTRSTIYILLPLSVLWTLLLVGQGTVQTFAPAVHANLIASLSDADGNAITEQVIARGPAASQIAIKQLGTNGGGFFNANSAHPFENPTPYSNFLEMLAILLIPAALTYTFGKMVRDVRQGWVLYAAMLLVMVPLTLGTVIAEQRGQPLYASHQVDTHGSHLQAGGNMEGKETRNGIVNSAIWAAVTTAASNGSVNAMHDSFTPLGGMVPMWLIQLGEVIFGGVGSGLYGLLMFVIVAVFVAGLMVGRTPEYLGKKIEAFEMKMASLAILVTCLAVLLGTAVALSLPAGRATIFNPGVHGFSEVLYAFSSAGNNNGSAFAGLGANTPFYNIALAICMLAGRYLIAVPVLANAGSLAHKKIVPVSVGTLPTHTPLFVVLLVSIVMLVGALTYVPALALGPIVEELQLHQPQEAPHESTQSAPGI